MATPDPTPLAEALADLESAEDFLDFFGVPYSPSVVQVNRLHILQRFHDYLARAPQDDAGADDATRRETFRAALCQAYDDFTHSDALGERVFRVLQQAVAGGKGCGSGGCGSSCGGARAG